MTISDALDADDAIGNLMRIRADTRRWRNGWTDLATAAETWVADREVAVLMLDIDKSASVRAAGIEAKVELVVACRQRVMDVLPDGVTVIDSGTRDETCLVLPDTSVTHAQEVAHTIRRAVSDRPFSLKLIGENVSITISIGIGVGRAADLNKIYEGALTGLGNAKRTRDADAVGTARWVSWTVEMPDALLEQCISAGIDTSRPSHEALDDVVMQYTGIHHWLVTNGFEHPESELAPTTWHGLVEEAMGEPDVEFLRLLTPVAEPTRPRYTGPSSAVTVTLSGSIVETLLAKVVRPEGPSIDDVVTEALSLDLFRSQGSVTERTRA